MRGSGFGEAPGLAARLVVMLALAVAAVFADADPAAANGYCGPDPTGASACPVTTNTTLSGSITSSTENDFYVFYVAPETKLTVTIIDVEDVHCSLFSPSNPFAACGDVGVAVLDSQGRLLAWTAPASQPSNGITVPESMTFTSIGPGVYYFEVSGWVDTPYTVSTIPYQLTVDGNPGVKWPPACIVPPVGWHTSLRQTKRLVREGHCTVGAVHHVRSPGTPRGDVVRLRPRSGSILPSAAAVAIYVSGRPSPHRSTNGSGRRHHRRRR